MRFCMKLDTPLGSAEGLTGIIMPHGATQERLSLR